MGLKHFKFPSKTDCHPPKGFINWWEAIVFKNGKSRERREANKEITDVLFEEATRSNLP